MTKAIVTTKP